MFVDNLVSSMRYVLYELLLSVFAPLVILLTFAHVANGGFFPKYYDVDQFVLLGSLFAFTFPFVRTMIYTLAILINSALLMLRLQTKCRSEWDCRSANDLFAQYFPLKY